MKAIISSWCVMLMLHVILPSQVHGFLPKSCPVTASYPGSQSCRQKLSEQQTKSQNYALPIEKTEDEWKEILTDDQYYILRKEGTETPGVSELNYVKESGTFCCAGCGAPLFVTDAKFDSGTGWPSFFQPVTSSAVSLNTDFKLIFPRTECSCSQCGGHLGHVFEDGPDPTGQRYCMNGAAMKFYPDTDRPDLAEAVAQLRVQDPFRLTPTQALPSAAVNGLIGLFFLSSFLSSERSSPVEYLVLLPAVYYGFECGKSLARIISV